MKKQSLSFLLAAALSLPMLAASLPALAQDAGTPADGERPCHGGRRGHHRDPERRLQHMTQALGLDANQVALVRQAFEQARAEHEALRAQPRSPERREQHRAIMERTRERIDAVLTPEQRVRAEQLRAQHDARRQMRREQRGGGVDPRGI
ncbi:hypothetical protein [Sandaracinus amylolyticus]|uniref:P pilus assembly/Cpx signaling pathway, periplasmic inhibitor/zinc-resistance associated protein n=1 Tax=Sandaracinus amylolyticus TaxID=927083 RepID=A0A0F6SEG7_9BACT|nr:hypothetical protein [Sandaracinus amylolyticus]AKF05164.1 hypothetical protein DB32_002313 [Sandaracinus amylolyticus]